VLPALAVSRALAEDGPGPARIQFVGSRRGEGTDLVAAQGFPVLALPGRGLQRRLRPRALLDNAAALAALAQAALLALRAVARWRPQVVVTLGGYASAAAGLAAVVLRRPLVVVTVDAVPGATNRLLGRLATANATAFPGTPLPRATVTGTPVRAELADLDRSEAGRRAARAELGLDPGAFCLVAFGGSLGARRINQAVAGLAAGPVEDLAVYHVTGRRDAAEFVGPDGPRYRTVAFEQRMDLLYRAADLCLCRAGAMTVAELAAAGVPALLVPLPGAPGDHQTANARALVEAGAAVLVPDERCRPDTLAAELAHLRAEPGRLEAMGRAARGLARPDAARRVADLARAVARP
jgi:undecaprenyldiphospho-muramoylpentapeptide beta-N-acetylglucosaminyltransferase